MKRLWGIRHLRWLVWNWLMREHARFQAELGIGLGHPHPLDIEWVNAIRRGEE